jgi:hypothetical protein
VPCTDAEADALLQQLSERVDPDQAPAGRVVVGVRLAGAGARQLVLGDGACRPRVGSAGYERFVLVTDRPTLHAWLEYGLDLWDAVLVGRLQVLGDADLAVRLPAWFGVG